MIRFIRVHKVYKVGGPCGRFFNGSEAADLDGACKTKDCRTLDGESMTLSL